MTKITVLSLGAGVQSSALALLAAREDIKPMPDAAVFADTGAESKKTYDYLDMLSKEVPFPIYRTMKDDGLTKHIEQAIENNDRCSNPPLFSEGKGMIFRACTRDYKIRPINSEIRKIGGIKKWGHVKGKLKVDLWIGISKDEMQRQKESLESWIEHRWPLIELGMTRQDCLDWMTENNYPQPPRSACVYCPYRNNKEWKYMKDNQPEDFAEAVRVDKLARKGFKGGTKKLYVHGDRIPLDEVDFSRGKDDNQTYLFHPMQQECDGMCGV